MFPFVVGVLCVLAALVAVRVGKSAKSSVDPGLAKTVAAVLAVIGVLLMVLPCIQTVSTKNVGIETAFGSTQGELSNGLHLAPPWINVTEMDAAIQTDRYVGTFKSGNCMKTRIANQQTACTDVTIRWRIRTKNNMADQLFQNYRTFENVRESLVTRELYVQVNNALAEYNPLNSVQYVSSSSKRSSTTVPVKNLTYQQISVKVQRALTSDIGDQVDVLSVNIPYISFDDKTQNQINLLQAQIAETRIAEQNQQTASAQAIANKDLSASVSHDPNVLVAQCMNTFAEMVKESQPIPAGFSCWPGSGAAGILANATSTGTKH